jgi:hypothetical protein
MPSTPSMTEAELAGAATAVAAEGDAGSFPLLLIPFDSMRISSRNVGDTPFMIKTVADTVIKGTDGFVEINPQTAAMPGWRRRPGHADHTARRSPGSGPLFEGIKPGVIAMARGAGAYSL